MPQLVGPPFVVGPGPFPKLVSPVDNTPRVYSVSPNTGNAAGGTAVTIKGQNFAADAFGNCPVTFDGGLATSVVVVDPQTITCVTPASTDTGPVDIVVYFQTLSGTLPGAFTYYLGVISELSPKFGPIVGGTPVALSGHNFVAGSNVFFDGQVASSISIIDAEHIKCTTPNHATGFVDVTVVEPGGAVVTLRSGFQYTLLNRGQDFRRTTDITIKQALSSPPNTCDFAIDGNAPKPQYGEKIEIHDANDNDRLLFGGTVQSVVQRFEENLDALVFDTHCVDYTWLFNSRRPYGSYVNTSVSVIVKDLAAKYAPGFTTVHVQSSLAKVTIVFNGADDFITCMNKLAGMIGGGHWFIDYAQDIHFFHIVPPGLDVPGVAMPAATAFMTVAEGALSSAGQLFTAGYYLFRHSFIYDDGSESSLQSVSNLLLCTGQKILSFAGVPVGTNPGSLTCIGRRIYYNRFVGGYPGGDTPETILGFCQINDNTTTAFTTWFGALGASVGVVSALGATKTLPTPSVSTPDGFALLSNPAAAVLLAGGVDVGTYGLSTLVTPPSDGAFFGTSQALTGAGFFTVGESVTFKFTVTNGSGETTLGGSGITTTIRAGITPGATTCSPIQAPQVMPTGGQNFQCYISVDGGVSYSRIAAGLFQGQVFTLGNLFPANVAPTTNTARILQRGWVAYNGVTLLTSSGPFPASGGTIAYFATTDLAAQLENLATNAAVRPPVKSFLGHPVGPAAGPTSTLDFITNTTTAYSGGIKVQFKVACLYRDGSISYPSPASPTLSKPIVIGDHVLGYNLQSIPIGVALGTLDVVARIIYYQVGQLSNPNYTTPNVLTVGLVWPISILEPDWSTPTGAGVLILPDNTTTQLLQFNLSDFGQTYTDGSYAGLLVGRGNHPYDNANAQLLSSDPIPIWPNPDGPFLEDVDPPDDITNSNTLLLRSTADGGSDFQVTTDLSQIRNRVVVYGSGSLSLTTAAIGDTQIVMNDISAFSPSGGTVKYIDAATGVTDTIKYNGIGGVAGAAFITLATGLQVALAQGSIFENFYQADDVDSQHALAKVEVDNDGNPTSGVHEFVIRDPSLKAFFQLYMAAHAQLELYSQAIVTIAFSSRDPKMKTGQTVHVDLSKPPCFGDFLIQSVDIDQIHNENDTLAPRYNVTASSVRYDLTDLLLQLLSGTTSNTSGPSSAGIAATSTQTSEAAAAAALSAISANLSFTPKPQSRLWWMGEISTASGGIQQAGVASVNQVGSSAGFIDSAGAWKRYTAASVGTNGMDTTGGWTWWDHAPEFDCVLRTGSSVASPQVLWVALLSADPPSSGTDVHTSKGAGFFCNGSNGWQAFVTDGTTQTNSGVLLPLANNTVYTLQVKWLTNTLAQFSINGTILGTLTVGAGILGTLLDAKAWVVTNTFSGAVLDIKSMYGERN